MPVARMLAACAQMCSRENLPENLATCRRLVGEARSRGAEMVVLPENFAFLGLSETDKYAHKEVLGKGGPIQDTLADLAARHGVWLVGGGMPEASGTPGEDRVYNTLLAYRPDGTLAASYRKIHMFDIDIPGGAKLMESASCIPGDEPVVVETPWGNVGLTICYDLRFPELYRKLVEGDARIVLVPAAFTMHTGQAHWHVLLRARAVENQVFVLAAAQLGRHNERRHSYGHALIVDPWGTVLADAGDREGVIVAELDFEYQDRIRRGLPCLTHRRV